MKGFNITVLILILALSSLKANAAYITGSQIKPIIEKQTLENYKQYTDADIKVESIVVPFKDFQVPEGKVTYSITSTSTRFMPRDLEKVNVFVNGHCVKTFNAAIEIKAYKSVMVASTEISREKALDRNVIKVERRDVSNILDNIMCENDLNKEIIAKKYFIKGELIDRRFVKIKPEIIRNSLVTVLFNTNNLTITIEARALSDGSIGDNICIMNKNYNKIYKGTVIGENKVMVKI